MPTIVETASLICDLDLIVTVDTMVAHLAGALGRPVWILLDADADWRWMRDRDDSPVVSDDAAVSADHGRADGSRSWIS